MTMRSFQDDSFISKSWSEYQAALQEADELFNRDDKAADDALDRAMEIADRMSAAPAQTLQDAVLKLELAFEQLETAHGDDADPAWNRMRQAFDVVRQRAAT